MSNEFIESTFRRMVHLRIQAVETMIEMMLTTPDSPGIAYNDLGMWLDKRVPFGNMSYIPEGEMFG